MSMNSMTLRWRTVGVCTLTVLAMLTLLGGCSKKAEQAETTTEEVPAAESASPMAGTTMTVMLNFAATGDTLSMTNAAAAGFGASVTMIKQHAGEEGHTH